MCRMQIVLISVALYVGVVHSWDIATSAGDNLLNFYTNDILTSTISLPSRKISALTFNEVHNMMLYVDKQNDNDIVCGYDLTSIENKCFTERTGRSIYGLAYDPVTERVFFTDTNDRSINWISLKAGSNYSVNLLINASKGVPRDIVVDSCNGYIYWLNTRVVAPTIERARLDGTEREVLETLPTIPVNATYNLEPNSLAIDQPKQRIYWMQPYNTTLCKLFTRLLNRKDSLFSIIRESNPEYAKVPSNILAISKDFIFQIIFNYAVYSFTKVQSNNTIPLIEKKTVYSDRKMPITIVANYKIKDQIQDCEALSRVKLGTEASFCVHGTKVNDRPACTCTAGYTGERCDVSVCDNYCLYGTCSFDEDGRPECRCTAGYSGERCQISVCENFCKQGNCSVNDGGLPICRCNAGYSGERCDVSACQNYCLHGNCSFNDEEHPECGCNAGYTGERCEINTCLGYCLNSGECSLNEEDEPSCECAGGYEGSRCEADKNDTLTILVNHHGKSSTYSFPVNCGN